MSANAKGATIMMPIKLTRTATSLAASALLLAACGGGGGGGETAVVVPDPLIAGTRRAAVGHHQFGRRRGIRQERCGLERQQRIADHSRRRDARDQRQRRARCGSLKCSAGSGAPRCSRRFAWRLRRGTATTVGSAPRVSPRRQGRLYWSWRPATVTRCRNSASRRPAWRKRAAPTALSRRRCVP